MANILIIDDDDSIRELLFRILSKMDHRVFEAENGDTGLDLFKNNQIDLVITDVIMEYSGLNVIKSIKEINNKIPIIAITGSLLSAAILQEDRLVNHTLVKPFSKDTLTTIIDETLNKI